MIESHDPPAFNRDTIVRINSSVDNPYNLKQKYIKQKLGISITNYYLHTALCKNHIVEI